MDELIKILKEGKIAIIPTDTTYGIVGDATNDEAVKKIFQVKKRDLSKAMPILVSDKEMLKRYVTNISELEQEIIDKYTPGKLSILLPKNDQVSKYVSPNPYVAIRIPDNEFLKELLTKLDRPIVATSANISGIDVISSLDELEHELKNEIDYIYDGGKLTTVPSTLIKIENEKITILREGEIANKIKKEFANYIAN